ncbi:uncharacterized protein HGUI_02606 [Hanseniaspora guilliermondii]|uniref:Uncharacterized protein n=1 Tax=Hanseniaspora guilliermondii TaxID=56406 RepID=A0A1L0FLG8_9ASCO|nr:uncharacterized protein HGUI_02606 [Hanseniaspora guilliermondii]
MSINSLEVNNLILQYLKENNLLLSYNAIKYELNEKYNININHNNVPYGMLINLIQKGIFYSQLESLKTNSNTRFIDDNIYTLQQLYEDNKDKLLYANKTNNKNNKKRKYNEDEDHESIMTSNESKNVTYDEIELEYKQRFSKAFEIYEQKCLQSDLNPKNDNSIKQGNIENIEPIVKYNTSCYAALSNDSLISTIKEPSRERGFLTSINLNNLINFHEDEHVDSIKMSKVIKKKMQTIDEQKDTQGSNSISLSALSNKDLLYYHLQNSNNTSIVDNDTIKEEEVVLFNQPSSNLIQFNKDKTLFSVGLNDGTILLYKSPENKLLTKLTMHHNTILHMNFNDDNTLLISIDTKGSIIVWNLKNFEIIKIIENLKIPGFESLFITNFKFMVPLKEDNKTYIGIYEVSDDLMKIKQLGRLKNSSSAILNMKMFSKYNLLLTLNDDNMVRIYKGKNTSTPTFTTLLTNENDNILDVYINEINENVYLISGVTIKAKLTNLLINISHDNCNITQLNTNTSMLMDVDEIPVISTDLFKKKYLVLGQVNGNVHIFDVSKLFNNTDESDERIFLKYQYLEKEENTHLTYMNVFDKEEKIYVNVGFDKGCSKIFNI